MFGATLIVFREVLEAALVIGIIAAATRNVPSRSQWLLAGIVFGLVGSAIIAAGTEAIARMASGIGQELFNALVLSIAVLMLAWHNIWMSSHGKVLAAQAHNVGCNIRDGKKTCSVLFMIVGLAVLREGSETVLFLYGIAASEGGGKLMLPGGLLGVVAGTIVGWALYAGLLRIPVRWFFAATGILVLLLAAGMASQAAHYLIQADLLPSLQAPIWDTSAVVPQDSLFGTLLHGLIGYDDRPAGMQIVFYVFTLAAITTAMKWARRQSSTISQQGVVT